MVGIYLAGVTVLEQCYVGGYTRIRCGVYCIEHRLMDALLRSYFAGNYCNDVSPPKHTEIPLALGC